MELLPPDLDRLETSLDWTMKRIPRFAEAGIKRVVSGPITHTPDGGFLLGPLAFAVVVSAADYQIALIVLAIGAVLSAIVAKWA